MLKPDPSHYIRNCNKLELSVSPRSSCSCFWCFRVAVANSGQGLCALLLLGREFPALDLHIF
jgi:hypothetical protein